MGTLNTPFLHFSSRVLTSFDRVAEAATFRLTPDLALAWMVDVMEGLNVPRPPEP